MSSISAESSVEVPEPIRLMACPGCRQPVIGPPPGSIRVWQCPFCSRRYRRRSGSSDTSGTIPCADLSGKSGWPSEALRRLGRGGGRRLARLACWLLSLYASGLLLLMVLYHMAMTVLGGLWLLASWPARRLVCPGGDGQWGSQSVPALAHPLGTWMPHFESRAADAHIGPVLGDRDAPGIFAIVAEVAEKLGAERPEQVRITYLPCCGVLEQRRRGGLRRGPRALVVGLPLLYVLTVEEFRAAAAHELAHLSRGDAALAAVVSRFIAALQQAEPRGDGSIADLVNPCLLLTRLVRGLFGLLSAPLHRYQEYRADRLAVAVCGSNVVSASLRKTAVVQPMFREVLGYFDPALAGSRNVYEFFRRAWAAMDDELKAEVERSLLVQERDYWLSPQPSLLRRLAAIERFPPHPEPDHRSARRLLADHRNLARLLHNYIFSSRVAGHTTYHRAVPTPADR